MAYHTPPAPHVHVMSEWAYLGARPLYVRFCNRCGHREESRAMPAEVAAIHDGHQRALGQWLADRIQEKK